MKNLIKNVSDHYNKEYVLHSFSAQRRFPNEELCRFMGRNFFELSRNERRKINILEVGCGSGANLWMIAREGFNSKGLDLSNEAIKLCSEMLTGYDSTADLSVGSMTELPYQNSSMHAVVDIFSSNCLDILQGEKFLQETFRVLKKGGKFFSYFPSSNSDTWVKAPEMDRIDSKTLKGIFRKDSPFYGNFYSFRFLNRSQYKELLEKMGFSVTYLERVGRTYLGGEEYFEFTVVEAKKT
jgi:ubiquinone/menaquinone biosynthesis C-methylase UbiE